MILISVTLTIYPLYRRIPLVRWSLHKYKYSVRGKGQGLSLQEGVSHTYTLRLC